MEHLGEQIDIHGGGNDLIFPHHENEIAQSEAATGKPFVRYWIHNGMLQLSGEKMSKSSGNLVTIEDFLSKHPADALRMMVLNGGYRNPLAFNDEVIGQTENALERLRLALKPAQPDATGIDPESQSQFESEIEKDRNDFESFMQDDFNTSGALSTMFNLVRLINQKRAEGATDAQLQVGQSALRELAQILGLRLDMPKKENAADEFINLLLEVRQEARAQKLWSLADMIRDRLTALGVIIEDSKAGSTWRWK